MPRRKTKKVSRNENISSSDVSIIAEEAIDDKVLKKEAFLRDFDIQVQRRLSAMQTQMKSITKEIERMFTTQKLKIKKDIRSMKVREFLELGGDMNTLDINEISNAVVEDVSFHEEVSSEDQNATFKVPVSTVKRTTRKRGAAVAQSPLVNDVPLTRTRLRTGARKVAQTPVFSDRSNRPMQTPLITPKFDPRLPLTAAREPKKGETLMSLAGSPVLHNSKENADDTLLSLCLSKQQTFLSGSLFDIGMSPNTLTTSKERLQEAIEAINSRLDTLDGQITSKLNES